MSGKGDSWRKGTDFNKYRDAPYWSNRGLDKITEIGQELGLYGDERKSTGPDEQQDGGSTPPISKDTE